MYYRIFAFFFLLAFLFSCGPKPAVLAIEKERLIPILVDVHIAEAAVQSLRKLEKDSVIQVYYNQIFEIHKISEDDFYASMEILKQDAYQLAEIYEVVLEEVTKKGATVGKN